jgi:hypothetical protein
MMILHLSPNLIQTVARLALLFWLCLLNSNLSAQDYSQTTRPWTYWWWMGSAVNEGEITRQLEQMAKVGLGGVHVIPIYGAKGYEKQFIPFLSERWLEVFTHTLREAKRLDLGVDLTLGTGWPYGGPQVSQSMAAQQWQVKDGQIAVQGTKQQVKRAAPGGEGLVLDPFDQYKLRQYLARFDSTLAKMAIKPRAIYNDSYEVYGANWTERFPEHFFQKRGYSFAERLASFQEKGPQPAAQQVRRDYHQTLAELLRDEFSAPLAAWAKQNGFLLRNQAHGSPGNLIDLYALADIPETESFGSSRFPIPGLRVDENYEPERFGTPSPLAMKFASSAAHLMGKPLVSAETTTWLADHFKVGLAQIKPQIDELFTAGVNHVFFHGTTYSPQEAGWPGWLFYASTNYGESSHFWPHLPLLNGYVRRCQELLQNSRPDNDLLVYFPIHNLWQHQSPSAGGVHLLEVHHVDRWLLPMPFGRLCDSLQRMGYTFDYVSDSLLNQLKVDAQKRIVAPGGGQYQAILLPPASVFPAKTLERLRDLEKQGAKIVYEANLAQLNTSSIRRETWVAKGLSFVRKKNGNVMSGQKTIYFIANLGREFQTDWVQLAEKGQVYRYDPLGQERILLEITTQGIYLNLPPGQSCFLEIHPETVKTQLPIKAPVSPVQPKTFELKNPWSFAFLAGKPRIEGVFAMPQVQSWHTLSDSAAYFSGKGRYTCNFDLPGGWKVQKTSFLYLDQLSDVASIRLNGRDLGTLWCLPFEQKIPIGLLKKHHNVLEIEVSNASANYLRLRDTRTPNWKNFYDINIVDIRYRPLDASRWPPMPAGLWGPVKVSQ